MLVGENLKFLKSSKEVKWTHLNRSDPLKLNIIQLFPGLRNLFTRGTPQDSPLFLGILFPQLPELKKFFLPSQYLVIFILSVRKLYKAQTMGKHNATSWQTYYRWPMPTRSVLRDLTPYSHFWIPLSSLPPFKINKMVAYYYLHHIWGDTAISIQAKCLVTPDVNISKVSRPHVWHTNTGKLSSQPRALCPMYYMCLYGAAT